MAEATHQLVAHSPRPLGACPMDWSDTLRDLAVAAVTAAAGASGAQGAAPSGCMCMTHYCSKVSTH